MTRQSFLELDSTYRNRNLDPKVSDFTVTLSQSGIKSQANAIDPVSNAYPVNVFSFSEFNQILTLESFDSTSNIVNTSSTTTLILSCDSSLGTQSGKFTGCVLVSELEVDTDSDYRRILDWKYLLAKDSKFYYKVNFLCFLDKNSCIFVCCESTLDNF